MARRERFRRWLRATRFGRWLTGPTGPTLGDQDRLIKTALRGADADRLRYTLDGTLSDTRSLVAGTLRQLERFGDIGDALGADDRGLHHAESHLLLHAAADAVAHLTLLERVRRRIDPKAPKLAPDDETRKRLREARNMLAAHREDRVLYRRLTNGEHTPRAILAYASLGIEIPPEGIDVTRYHLDGSITVGDFLSFTELERQFKMLESQFEEMRRDL